MQNEQTSALEVFPSSFFLSYVLERIKVILDGGYFHLPILN